VFKLSLKCSICLYWWNGWPSVFEHSLQCSFCL
jgi:hypothetical protein